MADVMRASSADARQRFVAVPDVARLKEVMSFDA